MKGFEIADDIVEGEVSMGGQEHFYLETHASLAVPRGEDGEMELFVSTQNPTETQVWSVTERHLWGNLKPDIKTSLWFKYQTVLWNKFDNWIDTLSFSFQLRRVT